MLSRDVRDVRIYVPYVDAVEVMAIYWNTHFNEAANRLIKYALQEIIDDSVFQNAFVSIRESVIKDLKLEEKIDE